jgi:hypothetical protein
MDWSDLLMSLWPVLAFGAGYVYRDFQLFRELIAANKQLEGELKKTNDQMLDIGVKNICKLKHETLNGIHYFYTEKDDTFVAQGQTLAEAAKHYTISQGRDILGWFNHVEQGKKYCFVNNECMEFVDEQH